MCGRFTLTTDADGLNREFGPVEPPFSVHPRYNIAPTHNILGILGSAGGRRSHEFVWGAPPGSGSAAGKRINARAETVNELAAFRDSFRNRRCLILADGFYEWVGEGKMRYPMFIQRKDKRPFAFAGIYEPWSENHRVDACTIITTTPNSVVAPIHDRMPAILIGEALDAWLDPDATWSELLVRLKPAPDDVLNAYAVSQLVNSPANDTKDCIKPTLPPQLEMGL